MNFASFITHFLLGCLIIFALGRQVVLLLSILGLLIFDVYAVNIFDVLFIKLGAFLEQQREINFFILG